MTDQTVNKGSDSWFPVLKHREDQTVSLTDSAVGDQLLARVDITALRMERCSLKEPTQLTRLTSLRELHIIAVDLESLAPLRGLKNLSRLSIIGCPIADAKPLLECASLREVVLRALPWSKDSRGVVLPRLRALPQLRADISSESQQLTCADIHQLHGVCAERVGGGKAVTVFYGRPGVEPSGAYLVRNREVRKALTYDFPRDHLHKYALETGERAPGWAHEVAAQKLSTITRDDILAALERASLTRDEREALRRFVLAFPDLEYAPRKTLSAADTTAPRDSIPPVLLALYELVGEWGLGGVSEVRFRIPRLRDAGPWWRWHPAGAWRPWDRSADRDVALFPIATDELEHALWVEAGPAARTTVWLGSISEHEPGRPLNLSRMTAVTQSVGELISAISAARLPDGAVIEAQDKD